MKGFWIPVLHSHLPFVKHPEYDYFLEEHWLFEAITETYIPLLMRLKKLEDEKVDFRLTVSITPPLSEMLSDTHLMEKYKKYLNRFEELTEKEIERTKGDETFNRLANFYNKRIKEIKEFFYGFLKENVLNGYRYFREKGLLEIITCGATHGFLPLLSPNKKSVQIQIKVAVENYEKHFGEKPKGIWLPESAYYVGLDEILAENGIEYFFLDAHGIIFGKPKPVYGVYAPVFTPSGVAAFGRDTESSKQVWSSKEGYPGDPYYRDFYRDIGYDLDFNYIKPYISPDGVRVYTGVKYYRITGDVNLGDKEPYIPEVAQERAVEHAKHFHWSRELQFEYLSKNMDRTPVVVSPYDAELFGHWWFEGVDFLYYLFKEIDRHKQFKAITPKEYLQMYKTNQLQQPSPSSWGDKGYYYVWLNGGNDWIYRHLHYMADEMEKLAHIYMKETDPIKIRTLNQMLRELLLAQSSDWAFLITTKTARAYAEKRTKEHINNFLKLKDMLISGNFDKEFIKWLEYKNGIFPELDFKSLYGGKNEDKGLHRTRLEKQS
ncbi:MAG: DUF1957 domain-containing protein [Aquificota bacterium]|nr:MAG: DUF1957 domain-containing protein [Aquificota bacterium]